MINGRFSHIVKSFEAATLTDEARNINSNMPNIPVTESTPAIIFQPAGGRLTLLLCMFRYYSCDEMCPLRKKTEQNSETIVLKVYFFIYPPKARKYILLFQK